MYSFIFYQAYTLYQIYMKDRLLIIIVIIIQVQKC